MNFFPTDLVSCKPISNLSDLLDWSADKAQVYNLTELNPVYYTNNDQIPKFIVCHDMKNNYLGDKFFQGSNCPTEYSFFHWNLIDTFIYFSHHFVTIPTESWINAAHENNCRILGTIITEFDQGEQTCSLMFQNLDPLIDQLVKITIHYGFDGWLINIENKINQMEKLAYFVENLTKKLKNINDKLYKIIWYDSVISSGELKWQNELNTLNQNFFQMTDGIFLNYTWKDHSLKNSLDTAKERFRDVYVGIDVFGRGCYGNGGFNTCQAMEKIYKSELSYALFAPGWIHECNDEAHFYSNSQTFWSLLNQYTAKRKIKHLPILSSFSHASGNVLFIQGKKFDGPWNNLNLQSMLPVVKNSQWDFEDGFFGSGCLCLQSGESSLFDLELAVQRDKVLVFELIYKSEGDVKLFLKSEDYYLDIWQNSNQLDILSTFEKRIQSWNRKKVVFKLKDSLVLKDIKLIANKELKLGLIRFLEKEELGRKLKGQINMVYSLMKLDNNLYLLIKLSIPKLSWKFYSILMDKVCGPSGKEKRNYGYVGSSKREEFSICLKLNENIFIDHTNESRNEVLKISFLVHEMDEQMENLVATEDIFYSDSVHALNFSFPKLKLKNSEDKTFLKQIVYDMEFF